MNTHRASPSPANPIVGGLAHPSPPRPPRELLDRIACAARPVVLGHITPDADCIGACLALCLAARARGIRAEFALPGGNVAKRLQFMLAAAPPDLVCDAPRPDHDALIILDAAGPKRVSPAAALPDPAGRPVLVVDHHLSNPGFGAVNWIEPHAASTSELVYHLLCAAGLPVTAEIASLLYAGIHGDTAGFSLPNTSADTLETAAALVRAGADVRRVGEALCRSQAAADFELLRRVYDNTVVTAAGRIAYSTLSHEEIVAAGCSADDIDDQVAVPRSLDGVHVALLFSEAEQGVVRVNLRGNRGAAVLAIAQAFGGGGHAESAGVRVRNRPLEDVVRDVIAAAERFLEHQR